MKQMRRAGEEEGHSNQYLLDKQFESTNPGVAPTHAVQMINLPYIFAELNTETKRRRRFGCGINTVCPRIVSSDDVLGCEVLSLFLDSECVVMQTQGSSYELYVGRTYRRLLGIVYDNDEQM